ncbi:MAG: DUF5686 and carboxypeptidase regulatory-like domain-containing protein [Crocinitomicaceae bacterium]|nr:DUF5686 and carboxypeptidase regulatory-like domain-containing protein [Crocinitomicaceae bacterium]
MQIKHTHKFLLFLSLFFSGLVQGQETSVSGQIKEDTTVYNVMYAKVYFMGTQVGTTSDSLGRFSLTIPTDQLKYDTLIVSYLGFKSQKIVIKPNVHQEVNIQLSSGLFQVMDEIKVIAGENPAWPFMRKLIENKEKNNPNTLDSYSSTEYSKIRFDLNNFTDKIKKNLLLRPFDYIWDNTKTTEDGVKYLPILMTEQITQHYYQNSPRDQKDLITGENTTGLAGPKLKQFTNDLYLTPNIYDNYITILGKSFPSPLNDNYKSNYKFYLMDSTKNASGKNYNIRFRPKYQRELGFTGEMSIDSATFAITEIKLRFDVQANVNFVRSYYINQFYRKIEGHWMIKESQVIGDFTVVENVSDLTGFFGRKKALFDQTEINKPIKKEILKGVGIIEYADNAENQDSVFWKKYRQEELSEEEEILIDMTQRVENDPAFKLRKNLILTFGTGYIPLKRMQIGNIYTFYSNNNIENHRFKFGLRTNPENKFPLHFSTYIAYGTKDKQWKYRLSSKAKLRTEGVTRIGGSYKYDIEQIGRSFNQIALDHIISSLVQLGNTTSRNYVRKFEAYFEQGLGTGFIARIGYFNKIVSPTNDSVFSRINSNGIIEQVDQYFTAGMSFTLKFSYLYKDITGNFYDKKDLYKEYRKYPDLALNYKYVDQDIFASDYSYQKVTISARQKVNAKKMGYFTYNIESGKTFGTVPHIDLNVPFGNQLILTDDYSFNLMNFMELASDQYIAVHASHHFNGLILDRIPLINKLKWRSFIFGKAFFGDLSDANDESTYIFPTGLSANNEPYCEVGFGIENIFKFAKMDFTWRLTPGQGEYYRFLVKPSFKFSF